MKKSIFILLAILIICSCAILSKSPIKKSEWLIGTWENKTSKGSIYEAWKRDGKNTFSGKSYILKGQDTVLFETISLVQEADGFFYIPNVKNQNNNQPVRFALQKITKTVMVFENPDHDFPSIISYTKINADSLLAEISGTKNEQIRKQSFPMRRVK